MLQSIVDSIFEPGVNVGVRRFTYLVFVLLILVLIGLMVATNFNIHVMIMTFLACGVLASLTWFLMELENSKKRTVEAEGESEEAVVIESKKDR